MSDNDRQSGNLFGMLAMLAVGVLISWSYGRWVAARKQGEGQFWSFMAAMTPLVIVWFVLRTIANLYRYFGV